MSQMRHNVMQKAAAAQEKVRQPLCIWAANFLVHGEYNRNRTGSVVVFPAGHLRGGDQEADPGIGSTLAIGVGCFTGHDLGRGEHIGIGMIAVDVIALGTVHSQPGERQASARGIIGDRGENRCCGRFTAGGAYAVFHRHIVRDLHIGDGLDDIPVCTARLLAVQDLQYAEANILISLQRRGLPCGVRYGSLCGRSSRRRP